MATSSITFYKTAIDPNRNMVIEGMTQYLQTCASVGPFVIMYVKPAMDIHLNIEWTQRAGWRPTRGTYAAVSTGDQTHYYFITKTDWVAESTVGLELHLDTINSFWIDYKDRFTDRTHITRQHRNRFQSNGARIVDEFDEGITPVLRPVGSGAIGENDPLWYLIYRSDTSDENSQISCYACSKNRYRISTGQSASTVRWERNQLVRGYYYYLIPEDDAPSPAVAVQYYANPYYTVTASAEKPVIKFYLNSNGYIEVRRYNRSGTADSGYPFDQSYTWIDFITSRRVYVTTTDSIQIADILKGNVTTVQAGSIGALYLESIDQVDRTDSLLIKILELGYAPFQVVTSSGNLQIPTGWTYDAGKGLLKLTSLNTEFLNSNIGTYSLDNIEYVNPLVVNPELAPDPFWESKLYNSNFFSLKFGYDTESWTFKPEKLTHLSNNTYSSYPYLRFEYKPSNGINSSCGFKFNHVTTSNLDLYLDDADYPNLLVSTRNNELPLYNNEYLNYLKYGKQYADRQTATNIGATWLNTLLSIGGGIAAGAIVGSAPGAIVGGIVGAISGTASAITSTVKAIDAQQQKEWELQHQTTNVAGNSDLDIFKWYSQGKLWRFTREVTPRMKQLLFQLFFRGGYSCNEYAVPRLDSRYWFNFIQCTPSFNVKGIPIYQNFLDDIIARYQAGVTIFHRRNAEWNLDYTKENWEMDLLSGVFNTDVTVTHTSTYDQYDITGQLVRYTNGDEVQFEWYWDASSWASKEPDDTTAVDPNSDGSFSTQDRMQNGIAIRARVRNTVSGTTYPWYIIWEA